MFWFCKILSVLTNRCNGDWESQIKKFWNIFYFMWYFPKWLTLLTNFYFLVQSWVLLYSEWTINKVIDTWYTVPVPFPYWQEKEKEKKFFFAIKNLSNFFFGGFFFKILYAGRTGARNETDRHQCKVTGLIPHLELIQLLTNYISAYVPGVELLWI